MPLLTGGFTLTWGANTLEDIETIKIDYAQKSDDLETIQHSTYEVDGPIKVSATLTLLASDIASLAAVLPQNYVAPNDTLSTGESVDGSVGAIDIVETCDTPTYNDLEIASCNNPSQILRIVNCRTKLDGISVDATVEKWDIKFVGESGDGIAPVQAFLAGSVS
jgi:hypothetical protein